MHKPAAIAISTLISVSLFQPAWADNNRRSVAVIPVMVLPAPGSTRVAVPQSAVRSAVKRAVKTGYPSNHFQRGMYLKQKGNLDGALIEFLKAAQENPRQVQAFYEQAIVFKQKGYNKLAQSSLQQALSVKPDFRDARVLLATIFLEGGEFSEAARELFNSLGLPGEVEKLQAKRARQTEDNPPAKLPTVIQTPHGSIKHPDELPAMDASPQSQQPAPLGGLAALLKGIPGVDPDVSEASTALPPVEVQKPAAPAVAAPTQPNATDIRVVNGKQLNDSNSRQVDDLLRQVHKQSKGFKIFSPFGWFDRAEPAPLPVASSTPAVLPDTEPTPAPEPVSVKEPDAGFITAEKSDKDIEKKFRRQRKARVTTWLDNLLDGHHQMGPDAEDLQEELHVAEDAVQARQRQVVVAAKPPVVRAEEPKMVYHVYPQRVQSEPVKAAPVQIAALPVAPVNAAPVQLPAVHSAPVEPSDEEQEIVEPENLERAGLNCAVPAPSQFERMTLSRPVDSPKAARAVATLPPVAVAPKSTSPSEAQRAASAEQAKRESWLPTPIDVSRLIQKAVAWMPLPVFKPLENSVTSPSATTAPLPVRVTSAAPVPLKPSTPTASALQLRLKAIARRKPAIAAPVPEAIATASLPVLPELPQHESAATTMKNVMSMLPKELAATLQQVLGPQPVEIAPQAGSVPQVMEPSRSGANVSAPAPKAATNLNVYENLVSAQLKAPAPIAQPVPRPRSVAQTAMPAPAPSAFAPTPQRQAATVVGLSAPATVAPAPLAQPSRYTGAPVGLSPTQAVNSSGRVAAALPVPMPAALATQHRIPVPQAMQGSGFAGSAPLAVAGADPDKYVGVTPVPLAISAVTAEAPELVASRDAGFVPAPVPLPESIKQSFDPQTLPVAARLAGQGFKFMAPSLTNKKQYVFSSIKAQPAKGKPVTTAPKMAPVEPPAPPEDEFSKRMKYLLEHGTTSLGPGEAFMFSEETGEGVMFLRNKSSIRRKIAVPRNAVEVARQRRPELLAPQGELQYNLSLLGKIIKPKADSKVQSATPSAPPASSSDASVNEMLAKQDGFFTWFKSVFKF